MDLIDIAKKLKLFRRTYSEWGAEHGMANFPSAGQGVFVPTYFPNPSPEPTATVIGMPQETWKEAVNG